MKIERVNESDIDIYVNPCNFVNIKEFNKEAILNYIKNFLLKISKLYKLKLSGFYKIKAYFNEKTGLFLNLIKIDDNEFSNEVDFRIILYQNEKYLFEIEEYELIKNVSKKMYYNGKFYIDINDLDDISKLIDMGKVIYGDEVKNIIENSISIK